jgi:hypothetical protein
VGENVNFIVLYCASGDQGKQKTSCNQGTFSIEKIPLQWKLLMLILMDPMLVYGVLEPIQMLRASRLLSN